MQCPKCGSRISKDMPVCNKCGFRVEELENVSNFKARKILKSGTILQREKVFYVHKVPKDLVRKDLVLLTGFLGIFGAHNFYVGRIYLGFSKLISFIAGILLSVIVYRTGAMQFYTLSGLLIAYPIVSWIYDFARVIIKKYPIPVVLDNEE